MTKQEHPFIREAHEFLPVDLEDREQFLVRLETTLQAERQRCEEMVRESTALGYTKEKQTLTEMLSAVGNEEKAHIRRRIIKIDILLEALAQPNNPK